MSSDIVVMGLMFGWKDGCTAPEHCRKGGISQVVKEVGGRSQVTNVQRKVEEAKEEKRRDDKPLKRSRLTNRNNNTKLSREEKELIRTKI